MVDELQDPLFRRRDLYSFRKQIQQSMNAVMEELGVSEAGAECRLVGVRRSSQQNMSDVCVVRRMPSGLSASLRVYLMPLPQRSPTTPTEQVRIRVAPPPAHLHDPDLCEDALYETAA